MIFVFLIAALFVLQIDAQLPWIKPQDINRGLPSSIEIYTLNTTQSPWGLKLTGGFAKINLKDSNLQFKIRNTEGGTLKTPMEYANQDENIVYVVINGGYFDMTKNVSASFICENGKVLTRNSFNTGTNKNPTVGAFGLKNGIFKTEWVYSYLPDLATYKFKKPNPVPGPIPEITTGQYWDIFEGVGAGPILVKNGLEIVQNLQNFNDNMILNRHPRSAICIDRDENLILMAIDGRYDNSDGLNMTEIRQLMLQLNCIEAMNLDGGGSTLLFANSRIINRPSDAAGPRPVASVVTIRDRIKRKSVQSSN